MDGFVDRRQGGVTELRVHGVSATPPDSMLQNPNVTLVSGDSTAGFYRRVWLGGRPSPPLVGAYQRTHPLHLVHRGLGPSP